MAPPRICELVEYQLEDLEIRGAWAGPGSLQLNPHALAPVAELPVLEVVSAVHFIADLTLGLGKAVYDYLQPAATRGRKGPRMRLLGKVAVVTGAASGIGKEIARAYRREGANVVIADLNQAATDAAAADLGGTDRCNRVAMDVTSEVEVEAGMAKTVSFFGRIDVLVSNAGIQIMAPLEDFDFAKWKQMIAIHLDGAFLTTRAVLKQMYTQATGGSVMLGALEGGLVVEGALRDGQAWTNRPLQGRCRQRSGHYRGLP